MSGSSTPWMAEFVRTGRSRLDDRGGPRAGRRATGRLRLRPVSDEMFEATPGRPALLNGHPIQVSSCASLNEAGSPDPAGSRRHPGLRRPVRTRRAHSFPGVSYRARRGRHHRRGRCRERAVRLGSRGGARHPRCGRRSIRCRKTPRYNRPTPKHDAIAMAGPALIETLANALGGVTDRNPKTAVQIPDLNDPINFRPQLFENAP